MGRMRSQKQKLIPKVYFWVVGTVALLVYSSWNAHTEDYLSQTSTTTITRKLLSSGEYPDDLFDSDQRDNGAIILHVLGALYMFVALAIVCDEFFVPALEEIVERYGINDDVAGATLMAAGGSAPELFTSLIGVFIADSNVGFGTIIGSAVFNVLFVIGMCAIFSSGVLALTWWPLARDCTFYTADLCILYAFFSDQKIDLWESGLMLLLYCCYVGFMYFNEHAEKAVKGMLGSKIKPTEEAESDEKELPAKQSSLVQLSQVASSPGGGIKEDGAKPDGEKQDGEKPKEDEDEDEEGLDLSWPDTLPAQINYVLFAPLTYTLWLTLPDCRKENGKPLWLITFIGSILWIGFYSYWMVWWATLIGNSIGIPEVVMGYTFLAAGTSVPDLISSVLVAKQGLGDMAVSSSIGSNIFDITFGLPLPWFFWSLWKGEGKVVESESLEFSLVLLIFMLVFVVIVIAACGWKMTKGLGGMMFALYALFLMLVLLQNYGHLDFLGV